MNNSESENTVTANKRSRGTFLIVSILVAVVIIVLLDAFCILSAFYAPVVNEEGAPLETTETQDATNGDGKVVHATTNENMESALLATGLSIIGIAISVWAVLNIINALDRRDVDEVKTTLEHLSKKHKNKYKELEEEHKTLSEAQKQYKESHDKLTKEYLNLKVAQQQNYKEQFVSELLKSVEDYSTKLIVEQIRNISVVEGIPFAKLTHLEQLFVEVLVLHQHDESTKLIADTADSGVTMAQKIIETIDDNLPGARVIKQYLEYRIGDFYFYKAYCEKDTDRRDLALLAIEQYIKSAKLFDVVIPEYMEQNEYLPQEYELCPGGQKRIGAYLCNAIGEAYSKIVQNAKNLLKCGELQEKVDEYKKKAVFYCAYAVKWCDRERELYFRNLGCALERVLGDDMYSEKNINTITKLYQDAFEISANQKHIPEKVFYTWLSFDWKWSDHIIAQIRGEIKDYKWLCRKSELVTEQLRNRADIAIHYGQLAKETYSDILVHHKFFAFTLRNVCIWEILTNGKTKAANRHYRKFKQAVAKLNAFYPDPSQWDDFMRELNQYVVEINSYLESHSVLVTTR